MLECINQTNWERKRERLWCPNCRLFRTHAHQSRPTAGCGLQRTCTRLPCRSSVDLLCDSTRSRTLRNRPSVDLDTLKSCFQDILYFWYTKFIWKKNFGWPLYVLSFVDALFKLQSKVNVISFYIVLPVTQIGTFVMFHSPLGKHSKTWSTSSGSL